MALLFQFSARERPVKQDNEATAATRSGRSASGERALPEIGTHYRNLDAGKVAHTLERLWQRIEERFPGSGLAMVCHELTVLAGQTKLRADTFAAPNYRLIAVKYGALAAFLSAITFIGWRYHIDVKDSFSSSFGEVAKLVQTIFYFVSMFAGAILFVWSLDVRMKRRQVLRDLHELRSITHVIDMHQLTKDPGLVRGEARSTVVARRPMSKFELIRYFDYCSEMLSLTSKLAAIYAQHMPDPVVISAVNDIETLAASLSRKIWQKISILESYDAIALTSSGKRAGMADA